MADSESPTRLIRTLSSQHWEVTETHILLNNLLKYKAGEYGNYTFYISRDSLESEFLRRETFDHDKLVSSVLIPCRKVKEYIDFYGYKKETYEKLTEDFLDCIRQYKPVLDPKEPVCNSGVSGRMERVIWVKGIDRDTLDKSVERAMTDKGYSRYRDYNFYEHIAC
jgi:hypothetical protein